MGDVHWLADFANRRALVTEPAAAARRVRERRRGRGGAERLWRAGRGRVRCGIECVAAPGGRGRGRGGRWRWRSGWRRGRSRGSGRRAGHVLRTRRGGRRTRAGGRPFAGRAQLLLQNLHLVLQFLVLAREAADVALKPIDAKGHSRGFGARFALGRQVIDVRRGAIVVLGHDRAAGRDVRGIKSLRGAGAEQEGGGEVRRAIMSVMWAWSERVARAEGGERRMIGAHGAEIRRPMLYTVKFALCSRDDGAEFF